MNILTHAVIPENVSNDILNIDEGQKLFEKFVDIRLRNGTFSVWDEMKKRKLGTFTNCNVASSVKNGDRVVKLKEERRKLQRFIIATRNRLELNLKDCIGEYELGVIPRFLFTSDGSFILQKDKAKVMHTLENLQREETLDAIEGVRFLNGEIDGDSKRVILFDAREIVK